MYVYKFMRQDARKCQSLIAPKVRKASFYFIFYFNLQFLHQMLLNQRLALLHTSIKFMSKILCKIWISPRFTMHWEQQLDALLTSKWCSISGQSHWNPWINLFNLSLIKSIKKSTTSASFQRQNRVWPYHIAICISMLFNWCKNQRNT